VGAFLGRLHPLGDERDFRDVTERLLGTPEALEQRRARLEERLDALTVPVAPIRAAWEELGKTACWSGPARLVHGDLYGRHVLLDAKLEPTALIDWGDLHRGDPALDLSLAWTYFAGRARAEFLKSYARVSGADLDPATLSRARLRALEYGVVLLHFGGQTDDELVLRLGRIALRHALGGR
jgi:aminoglycoside phosphotransferase (APT) family kinase protein